MEIYVAYFEYHDKITIVYVGTDLEQAKKEAMERSDWAHDYGLEVWKDGYFDREIPVEKL